MQGFTKDYTQNIEAMRERLRSEASFDIIERHLSVLDRDMCFFYIDGFTKDGEMQRVMQFLLNLKDGFNAESVERQLPYVEVERSTDIDAVTVAVLSGQTAVLAESFCGEVILVDARTYPARDTAEPTSDKPDDSKGTDNN
jgi:stage V sporulation protein AF